jgi:hypothetical protein
MKKNYNISGSLSKNPLFFKKLEKVLEQRFLTPYYLI